MTAMRTEIRKSPYERWKAKNEGRGGTQGRRVNSDSNVGKQIGKAGGPLRNTNWAGKLKGSE
jgi:hypothetical protein